MEKEKPDRTSFNTVEKRAAEERKGREGKGEEASEEATQYDR
jgi:hypothetical protein